MPPGSVRARILIASASPDEREKYSQTLERQGFETSQAATSAEAFAIACDWQPALIILDMSVNASTLGVALLQQLNTTPIASRIPIMALSGLPVDAGPDQAAHTPGGHWHSESVTKIATRLLRRQSE